MKQIKQQLRKGLCNSLACHIWYMDRNNIFTRNAVEPFWGLQDKLNNLYHIIEILYENN